jgi:hypothetical protein
VLRVIVSPGLFRLDGIPVKLLIIGGTLTGGNFVSTKRLTVVE